MPTTRLTRPMQTQHTTTIPNVRRSGERMRHDPLIRRWMERARSALDYAASTELHPEVKWELRDNARFAVKAARIRFRRLMCEVRALRAGYIDVLAHEPAHCT